MKSRGGAAFFTIRLSCWIDCLLRISSISFALNLPSACKVLAASSSAYASQASRPTAKGQSVSSGPVSYHTISSRMLRALLASAIGTSKPTVPHLCATQLPCSQSNLRQLCSAQGRIGCARLPSFALRWPTANHDFWFAGQLRRLAGHMHNQRPSSSGARLCKPRVCQPTAQFQREEVHYTLLLGASLQWNSLLLDVTTRDAHLTQAFARFRSISLKLLLK